MSNSETKTDTLEIGGMHCASCVAAVEKALSGVPGVERASVNLATEKATVEYDGSRELDDEFRRAVENAGFEVLKSGFIDRNDFGGKGRMDGRENCGLIATKPA